jgi:hypothetical protein
MQGLLSGLCCAVLAGLGWPGFASVIGSGGVKLMHCLLELLHCLSELVHCLSELVHCLSELVHCLRHCWK